jgi:Mu-like prophage major head subunit gpT
MAISRAQLLKELLPGLNALFGMEYARYGEEHKEIYETETSERSFEEEVKLSGFSAAPVKNEGQAIRYDNAQEAWSTRYNHETIALGFSITEEAVEDNLYDSLSARYTKSLARAMAYTKQVKAASVLNNGFSGSYLGGDGVSLFGYNSSNTLVNHPLVSGGTNANTPSTQADLNETSLEAAVIQIAAWTDERGLLIAAKPKKMVVPPALQFVATRLLETNLRVGTTDNDINAIKNNGAVPEGYTINHFLTDNNAWFLTTDVPNGLKHFVRTPLQNSMDGDFDTGNVRYKARERYSFGWSDALGIWGSSGSN